MAKWGEGDPRWIVEERPDATNVNNWHWTEKNASQWSIDKIKELFANLKIENEVCSCEVTEVSKCDGEAVANNRKAKLIFFYEWNIQLKWEGKLIDSETEVKGKMEIPNLSEENEPNEIDVSVTLEEDSPEGQIIKDVLRHTGADLVREQLGIYIQTLKQEFSQGMILPTKRDSSWEKTNSVTKPGELLNGTVTKQQKSSGARIETSKLKLVETLKCTADDFYKAMTIPEMVQAFTQNPCLLEVEIGGRFELFGGNVTGNFVELEPNKKIRQRWRFKTWPDVHHSEVTFKITQKEDSTEVELVQTSIPTADLERTQEGWKRYYFENMKRTFGFGAHLF